MEGAREYVCVASWPERLDETARAGLLTDLGMPAYEAGESARRKPPMVLARCNAGTGAAAVARLQKTGVGAAWLSHEEIRSRLDPPQVKTMKPAMGAPEPLYLVEFWRGEPVGMKAADIVLLVRGRVRTTKVQVEPRLGAGLGEARIDPISGLPDFDPTPTRTTTTKYTDLLDIHLRDGTLMRCNSSRLSFEVLRESRGLSDFENTDRLAIMLGDQAPGALIDTAFEHAGFLTVLVPDFRTAGGAADNRWSLGAFSVYSAWLGALHARLGAAQ